MKRLMVLAVAVMAAGAASAYVWRPLSVPEMAQWNATHVLEFDYSDLSASTATNTAKTITLALPAKTAAEFRAMILLEAFDTGDTNYTGSVAMKVGDGSDDDLYLTSTELASDGTEIFVKYAPVVTTAATSVLTPLTKEVFVAGTEDGTNFVTQAVVTNATVATSMMVTELGRKASTAAHNVVVTLTPNEEEALSANSSGKVKLFFRLTDWRK